MKGADLEEGSDVDTEGSEDTDSGAEDSKGMLEEEDDVVFSALPKPPDVMAVFSGDTGLLSGLGKDKIWVDHSTTDYEQTVELNDQVIIDWLIGF